MQHTQSNDFYENVRARCSQSHDQHSVSNILSDFIITYFYKLKASSSSNFKTELRVPVNFIPLSWLRDEMRKKVSQDPINAEAISRLQRELEIEVNTQKQKTMLHLHPVTSRENELKAGQGQKLSQTPNFHNHNKQHH